MSGSNSTDLSVVERVLHYNPNKPLAVVSGVLFTAVAALLLFHVFRHRHWWGLCLPIGAIAYAAGFFLRIVLSSNPDSLGLFIGSQLFTVTAPAAFLAFNYIVYGRLINNHAGDRYSLIRSRRVARVFVISDVTTFLIQGGGGGLESNPSSTSLGSKVLLIGLILQTVSYIFFVILLIYSHWRIAKDSRLSKTFPWRVVNVLYISSTFIIIRGFYRMVELAQGDGGFLVTHEAYLYALDTLPLFLAIVVYIPYWPGRHIAPKTELQSQSTEIGLQPYA